MKAQIIFMALLFLSQSSLARDLLYEKLFPFHVSVCAATPKRLQGGHIQSPGGHVILYLKGACRVKEARYPRIEVCDHSPGLAISVNNIFKNANWVAIENDDVIFGPNSTSPENKITLAQINSLTDKVFANGSYAGIQMHDDLYKNLNGELPEHFMAKAGFDTDYSLTAARTVLCSKLPVTKEIMKTLIDDLNYLNSRYAQGAQMDDPQNIYQWNILSNNCAHTVHNTLARLGIWEHKNVQSGLRTLSNLAVPANEAIEFADLTHHFDLKDLVSIYKNEKLRKMIQMGRWLPVGPGNMVELHYFHSPNEVYDPIFSFFILQFPGTHSISNLAKDILDSIQYTDLKANFEFNRKNYLEVLAGLSTQASLVKKLKPKTSEARAEILEFHSSYSKLLKDSLIQLKVLESFLK